MPSLPTHMRAIEITRPGGPEVLSPVNRPMPEPGEGQVLIEVCAAGINRPDCLQREGKYPPPKGASDIPGLEVSGVIVAIGVPTGKAATRYTIGDKVMALVTGGGYSQYVVADEGCLLPIPEGLSMVEAAAIPETFFTVWHNVFQRGKLKTGETFLVHGGTSGIGTSAIQLAKQFGATVIATAGTQEKCDACIALGADLAINYRKSDFVEAVKNFGDGANLILDMVGGSYTQRNYAAAAMEGRIVQIAFLEGADTNINMMPLMLKRLTHTGSTLRARSVDFKQLIAQDLEAHVWPLIAAGKIKPVIDREFALEEAVDAHRRIEASRHIGKIVLNVKR